MQKYDLGAIPVVDKKKKLLGRITIDDIVDLIKEEAEEDYQLAAGILQDVDVDDTIFELTKARLPWLIVGLIGGIGAAFVMVGFDEILIQNEILFYFSRSRGSWHLCDVPDFSFIFARVGNFAFFTMCHR